MENIVAQVATQVASSISNEAQYYPIIIDQQRKSFSIINNGTAAAPCRCTIIPRNDIMQMTIQGLTDEEIKINRILAGQALVIDGIEKTITLAGDPAFDHYDAWEFPKLQPGENTIKLSEIVLDISIEYQPRWI